MILRDPSTLARINFRILEKISQKSAAMKAAKLWLTPATEYIEPTDAGFLAGAQKAHLALNTESAPSEKRFTRYIWGTGEPILLVHDWGQSAAQMAPLAAALVRHGFQVVAFDAVAHGDSPGEQTHLAETTAIIKELGKSSGTFSAIVAHSTGAVSAVGALQQGVQGRRLVLSNAAASIDFYLREFCRHISISRQTMGRMSHYINTSMGCNLKDFSIVNIIPKLNVPGLILHDKYNDLVDYEEALTLNQLWPTAELRLTEGLDHDNFLSQPEVIEMILSYLPATPKVIRPGVADNAVPR